jgi:hypothetical protein
LEQIEKEKFPYLKFLREKLGYEIIIVVYTGDIK